MGGLPAKGQNLPQICFNRTISRASPLLPISSFFTAYSYATATSRTFTTGMFFAFSAASMYDLISLKFR